MELLTTKFRTLSEPLIGENYSALRDRLLSARSLEQVSELTELTRAERQ